MPIKFRCPNCRQFLGISRAKAGTLSDCPTCGRTLRIPALDGTLAPLPAPRLNLEDSELREALGALACLNEEGQAANLEFVQVEQPPLEQSQPEFAPELEHPVIIVEPVGLPAPDVDAPPETPVPIDEQLEELANLSLAMPIIEGEREANRNRFDPRFVLLGVAVAVLVAFFTGRLTAPQSVSDSSAESLEDHGNPEAVRKPVIKKGVANSLEASPSLSGRLTYLSMSGDVRPDKGARILVLPKERLGSSKLSGDGFRVGANDVDQDLLTASATALRGGFTFADADGKYQIGKLPPGEYSVLIESRYQPRDDSQPLLPNVSSFIEQYFEHPSRVLGQIQHVYQEIKVTADEEATLDYQFEKE